MIKSLAHAVAAMSVLLAGGCSTQRGQASTDWEYQQATNAVEIKQMENKGWSVAGINKFTDARGEPQINYIMKRPMH